MTTINAKLRGLFADQQQRRDDLEALFNRELEEFFEEIDDDESYSAANDS